MILQSKDAVFSKPSHWQRVKRFFNGCGTGTCGCCEGDMPPSTSIPPSTQPPPSSSDIRPSRSSYPITYQGCSCFFPSPFNIATSPPGPWTGCTSGGAPSGIWLPNPMNIEWTNAYVNTAGFTSIYGAVNGPIFAGRMQAFLDILQSITLATCTATSGSICTNFRSPVTGDVGLYNCGDATKKCGVYVLVCTSSGFADCPIGFTTTGRSGSAFPADAGGSCGCGTQTAATYGSYSSTAVKRSCVPFYMKQTMYWKFTPPLTTLASIDVECF